MSNTCSLCNSTYVWSADIKRHLKSKHGHKYSFRCFILHIVNSQFWVLRTRIASSKMHLLANLSNTCSLCNSPYVWSADIKRHLKSKHGQQKSTLKQQQPHTFTPEQQQQYSQSNEEEPCYMTQTNNRDS
jgi:hypothetical protein